MSFSFTADEYARIGDGARRVETQAASHEQQMESLLAKTETDVELAFAALSEYPAGPQACLDHFVIALRTQLQRSQDSVATARQMCVAARENRLAAARLASDLVGSRDDGESPPRPAVRHAVLVVDDYEESRELVSLLLHDAGFIVRTASNGLEAIIAAYEMRPSVIVMDVTMPVLDGLEATRLIKAIDAIRDAPVIAYTAKPVLSDILVKNLFAAVLQKPAPPELVLETVRRLATV